jgi:hypothetical protein
VGRLLPGNLVANVCSVAWAISNRDGCLSPVAIDWGSADARGVMDIYMPLCGCVVLCEDMLLRGSMLCVSVCVLVWFGVICFCDAVCWLGCQLFVSLSVCVTLCDLVT